MLAIVCAPLSAHHGADDYDTSTLITIDGRVLNYELIDPHSYLLVEVVDAEGTIQQWLVEGGSASGAAHLSRRFLASEPYVRIQLYQSKDKACFPACRGLGRQFEFSPNE